MSERLKRDELIDTLIEQIENNATRRETLNFLREQKDLDPSYDDSEVGGTDA